MSLQPRLVVHLPIASPTGQVLSLSRSLPEAKVSTSKNGNFSTGSITIAIFKASKFDKLQTSSNPDPSSADLSKPCLFPPAESSETWNQITVMNEKVGLSSDRGDEWGSQTASKEQSDNARR
jgi:hypothetical protein